MYHHESQDRRRKMMVEKEPRPTLPREDQHINSRTSSHKHTHLHTSTHAAPATLTTLNDAVLISTGHR